MEEGHLLRGAELQEGGSQADTGEEQAQGMAGTVTLTPDFVKLVYFRNSEEARVAQSEGGERES